MEKNYKSRKLKKWKVHIERTYCLPNKTNASPSNVLAKLLEFEEDEQALGHIDKKNMIVSSSSDF